MSFAYTVLKSVVTIVKITTPYKQNYQILYYVSVIMILIGGLNEIGLI